MRVKKIKSRIDRKKIRPIGNNLLILPDISEIISKGGIILPERSSERKKSGIVKAVGKRVIGIKRGDRVLYRTVYTGEKVDKRQLMDASNIIAIIYEE